MKNPIKDRIDLNVQLKWPVLSWSSMNAFESYDREDWYQKYVLGIKGDINPAMQAGIEIGERWANDPQFLPTVERPEVFEYNLCAILDKIPLTGHFDGLSLLKKKKLWELKTSQLDKRWNSKSAREWGQINFYLLLLMLNDKKLKPEDFEIDLIYVPVVMSGDFKVSQCGDPIIIPTVRTTQDVLFFGAHLEKVYKEMEEFIHKHA